jgi:hypothetical protein
VIDLYQIYAYNGVIQSNKDLYVKVLTSFSPIKANHWKWWDAKPQGLNPTGHGSRAAEGRVFFMLKILISFVVPIFSAVSPLFSQIPH